MKYNRRWRQLFKLRRERKISQTYFTSMVMLLLVLSGSSYAQMQSSNEQKLSLAPLVNNHQEKHPLTILSKIAPVLGESAILDKETNRVFWQGGKQSLYRSIVGHSYLSEKEGIARHIRATLLSCILWISCIRFLSQWLLKQTPIVSRVLDSKGAWTSKRARDLSTKIFLMFLRFILIVVSFLPKFHSGFVIIAILLYFIESYTCSTRIFLDNALNIPDQVEEHMEGLRKQQPIVKWEIRCFHYERKRWLSVLLLLNVWEWFSHHLGVGNGGELQPEKYSTPSIMRKKVVTHTSTERYKFESWEDQTVAGIWKQSQGTSLTAQFTKISLSKVVLFSDAKAKTDYFDQQSKFVNRWSKIDELAEFSTNIEVHGFRPKLLAIQPSLGLGRHMHQFHIHHFWLFTILGLTVPFRILFARHCDELRVAVVKETSSEDNKEESSFSILKPSWMTKQWFGPSISQTLEEQGESFRSRMEEMSLYEKPSIIHEESNMLTEEEIGVQSMATSPESSEKNITSISTNDVNSTVILNKTDADHNSTDISITSSNTS